MPISWLKRVHFDRFSGDQQVCNSGIRNFKVPLYTITSHNSTLPTTYSIFIVLLCRNAKFGTCILESNWSLNLKEKLIAIDISCCILVTYQALDT